MNTKTKVEPQGKRDARSFRKPEQVDLEDYLEKTRSRGLNDRGQLIPDPTPIAPPIGYKRQPTMVEMVRQMVQSENLAREARAAGVETFEESEDFDVGDDGEDLRSGFENDFDPDLAEVREAVEEARTGNAPVSSPENPVQVGVGGPPEAPPAQPAKEE